MKSNIKRMLRPKFLYYFFNSTKPISNLYGLDRGNAIDRYYIENFLEKNKKNIKGFCLELLNNEYTQKYGDEIIKSDILDIDKNNKNANIIKDIKKLDGIKNNTYDCIILTQVLQFIDDLDSAISECHRVLKPEGVLLATLPSVSRIDCLAKVEGDFWRFTKASAKYLFSRNFSEKNIEIETKGNAQVCAKFILGFAREEISKKELDTNDENFPLIVTVRAVK